jgi:signal transduction histidine kinase
MTRLVARILPRTIVAQITGLIVISLMLACAMMAAVLQFLQPEPPPRLMQATAFARAVTIVQLAKLARSPADMETLLSNASRAGIDVERANPAEYQFGASHGDARMGEGPGRFGIPFETLGVENLAFRKNVMLAKLDENTALLFRMPLDWMPPRTRTSRFVGIPLIFVLVIVSVFVTVLSVYAVRWVIAPLSSFALAARSFGRSPNADYVLKEAGPREIVLVAQALNEMRARIRSIVERRTSMLAAIGHDLRTPLTRLRLHAERVDCDTARDSMVREIVTIDNMLSDTLTYLKDDTHAEPGISVDLPSLLQTICSEFSDLGYRVSYCGIDRVSYICRPKSLRRAVTNLVENGIRHGSEVLVSLNLGHSDFCIEVSDDGPGMPFPVKEDAFEPFFKGDTTRGASDHTGFGLGLSIARDVIQDHGGHIRLCDREPHGLRVRIRLPVPALQPKTVRV